MRSRNSTKRSRSSRASARFLAPLLGAAAAAAVLAGPAEVPKASDVTPKKPVEIRSKELTFERETGLTRFLGDVMVEHGEMSLSADEVRATSGNRQATAEGNVRAVDGSMAATLTCGHLEYRDLMRVITAHDEPLLVSIDDQGRPVSIVSRQMEFYSDQRTAVANQGVVVTSAEGYATAGKAVLLQSRGEVLLEKDPKVYTTQGSFSGRKLRIGLTDDRFTAEGGVDVLFYPTPQARAPVPPAGGAAGPAPVPAAEGTGKGPRTAVPPAIGGVPTGPGSGPAPSWTPTAPHVRDMPGWRNFMGTGK